MSERPQPDAAAPHADGFDLARARLEALYAAHATAVHAYARRRTDTATAEDVVAETFLVAWRRRERLPTGDPLPWLYATARHVLANQRRGERRRDALTARIAREPMAGVGAAPAASGVSEEGERLLRALATLRPDDREALLLIAWEELPPARAAAALECSRATFNVRLHRARKRLEAAIERLRAQDEDRALLEARLGARAAVAPAADEPAADPRTEARI